MEKSLDSITSSLLLWTCHVSRNKACTQEGLEEVFLALGWVERTAVAHVTPAEPQVLCPGQCGTFEKDQEGKKPELKKELYGTGLLARSATKPIMGHDFGEFSSQQPMSKGHGTLPSA